MAFSVVDLACDALGKAEVARVSGTERMNALFHFEVHAILGDAFVDLDALIGEPARLSFRDDLEGSTRPVDCVVVEAAYAGAERNLHRYVLSLGPPEQKLTLRTGYRIFLDKAVQEIVKAVLTDAGVPASRLVFRLSRNYFQRPQCTQYGESEWAFVERLLADEGIAYWFDFLDGPGAVLVFGDAPGSHEGILAPVTVPFLDPSGMVGVRFFSELEVAESMATEAVALRDFDVRNPDVYVKGKAGEGLFSHFEFPAFLPPGAVADERAEVRLAQLRRSQRVATAASDCARLQPGRVVKIDGCADDALNGKYLVVELEHTYERPLVHEASAHPYKNRARMVPADRCFRPAIPAAPRFDGVESAVTTGPGGEEIHVDDLGQVKLRFLWDRSGITDDKSSRWARCLQMGMGASMLLPRVGWEVPVMYMDGNPDDPFVVGRFYNATAVVPYALPGAAATTSLQSATSPGDGTVNEVRLVDDAGSQELYVHASRDQSVIVGGTSKTKVTGNETHDVGLALAVVVTGSQSLGVGAAQTINIGTDSQVHVEGGISKQIGAMEHISVTGNRMVAAESAYAELIGAAYGLQCNQSNLKVQGVFLQMIGARMALAAGLGHTESVALGRLEAIGGSYNVVCRGLLGEIAMGVKRITADGADDEEANGAFVTSTKAAGTVTLGSASLTATGPFLVTAKTMTLDVSGTIKAKEMDLGGGKVHAKSGTTKVKGTTTKRPAGAKIT